MFEDMWHSIWLGLAASAAGAVNSIAGGGTLLTFPGLLTVVSPVVANGTSTVALVPGSLSAAWGYRREMRGQGRRLVLLALPSVAGGVVGSLLVTRLDLRYFDRLVPWLILTAATLFLCQPFLTRLARSGSSTPSRASTVAGLVLLQFLVAIYGGYFGAGIGILMLSGLGLMGLGDIHAMNGLKNFLAVCINGVSVAVFAIHGAIDWRLAGLMAPAAILGAYLGARLAQRLDRRFVRLLVVGIGFALAGHFLIRRWVDGS
jgi:uncharacterized membrane protein YfcA